ncbi:hypothetical protein ACSW8L_15570 (plasmid) [Clostridium perfringens]
MGKYKIDLKRCFYGSGAITTDKINEHIDFLDVKKVFINKYTLNRLAFNDLKYRNDLKDNLIVSNMVLNIPENENIYKHFKGGIDEKYYYTKDSKFNVYIYEEVKVGYILFANKNSKIVAYAKIDF